MSSRSMDEQQKNPNDGKEHFEGESPDAGQLDASQLDSYVVPEPSANFVDDTLLRVTLARHKVPEPSKDFVDRVLFQRALDCHHVPAASGAFVDRVVDAIGAGQIGAGQRLRPELAGPREGRIARTLEGPGTRKILGSRLVAAAFLAAAILVVFLPRILGARIEGEATLPFEVATSSWQSASAAMAFQTGGSNPLARTAAFLRASVGPERGLAVPRYGAGLPERNLDQSPELRERMIQTLPFRVSDELLRELEDRD